MAKNLVIVESPAKAKTIEGFLGKDFLVKSSFGHVRDLVKKGLGVNIEHNFEPTYEVSADKKNVIADLKKLSKEAETVWLASDEDREGEAISWHLAECLKLDVKKTKRIVFHEITKPAIQKAIENPRTIDINMVNAQQARRVLDRLVGFELSPILWKKIKPSLSAGRVQSVAVRLLVEREREIHEFKTTSAFKVTAIFTNSKGASFKAELNKRFANKIDARQFVEHCIESNFSVSNLETKPSKKSPSAPFTTSTLQQEAARKLGFSVAQTMVVAQRLYEAGKITYMRTDSTNLSDTALQSAENAIVKNYGEKYHQRRQYKTKNKGAQEAHEAIRPTYMENSTVDGDSGEKRLYELIWKRTVASQMADAQLERTTVNINVPKRDENFVAKGEVIKFDGFLKLYLEGTDDENNEEDEGMLPGLAVNEKLQQKSFEALQRYTQHPARYTEASLVKKLEELGIGRPSTYAPTINTVQQRGYVVKEDRDGNKRNSDLITWDGKNLKEEIKTENTGAEKSKLFPTDIGTVVNDFLVEYFKEVLDYNFTASVEKEFDEIADGNLQWTEMITHFYKPFHTQVEKTVENSERASGERLLGIDPVTGKNVYARIGRYGALVQIGEGGDDNNKPKFASLKAGQRLETINLEQALELFKLPRLAGSFENAEMQVALGRFGPYIKHKSAFYSLRKEDDPMTVSEERCIELILAKRKADSEKLIKSFDEHPAVQILNGRWGPYLAIYKENYKLPKDKDPKSLTFEDCLAIAKIDAVIEPKAKAPAKKAAASKPKVVAKKAPTKKAAPKKAAPKKK
jgi:DNA topoisomerase-1